MSVRKRALSTADSRDQQLLLAKWRAIDAERARLNLPALSTYKMAERWGYEGEARSVVSTYLHGHTALNTVWKLRFAIYLACTPQEIWPNWEYRELTTGFIPAALLAIAEHWAAMDEIARALVLEEIARERRKSEHRAHLKQG